MRATQVVKVKIWPRSFDVSRPGARLAEVIVPDLSAGTTPSSMIRLISVVKVVAILDLAKNAMIFILRAGRTGGAASSPTVPKYSS